jgi:hypothetical protein
MFKKTSDEGLGTADDEEEEEEEEENDDDDFGDLARAEVLVERFEEGGGLKDKAMAGLLVKKMFSVK